jgi:hypothetical protein
MQLKFILKIEGDYGIPDSDWVSTTVIDSDSQYNVIEAAKKLIASEHSKKTGKSNPNEDILNLIVTCRNSYLEVCRPGESHGYLLSYTVTPVLMVGVRAFTLTEVEI